IARQQCLRCRKWVMNVNSAMSAARPLCLQERPLSGHSESAAMCHNPTWYLPFFSLCQRLRNFAGVIDEKLGYGAECAVFQGADSKWYAGMLQFDGQNLDLRTLGQSQS